MKKGLMAIVLGGMVAIGAAAAQKKTAKLTCTLTNKTVETCCCVE
jgi:hypothetical protein